MMDGKAVLLDTCDGLYISRGSSTARKSLLFSPQLSSDCVEVTLAEWESAPASAARPKHWCSRPLSSVGGMLPFSQTMTEPTSGGRSLAQCEARPNCRWESQRTMVHVGRAATSGCPRYAMHGCASRQSVTRANVVRVGRPTHCANWFAFLRQTSDAPRPCSEPRRAWRRPSFSRLWQCSWHQTSLHQPLGSWPCAFGPISLFPLHTDARSGFPCSSTIVGMLHTLVRVISHLR
mmetsp:Transcript_121323/g.377194  ORF Transcript_121323/g.377194 Transcript_121323/m.377194 type:complete len:234 (+) Transcript_121323:201-902(+)